MEFLVYSYMKPDLISKIRLLDEREMEWYRDRFTPRKIRVNGDPLRYLYKLRGAFKRNLPKLDYYVSFYYDGNSSNTSYEILVNNKRVDRGIQYTQNMKVFRKVCRILLRVRYFVVFLNKGSDRACEDEW